jgi:Uma2 family endonuclease
MTIMSAIKKQPLISVEDYLAGELNSPVKHEYCGGVVYSMAGAKNNHNRIATNLGGLMHARLRKKKCQPFNSDTKIRIKMYSHVRFYYPDLSVVCHSNPGDDSFQDQPVMVVEVASPSTKRIDAGEKKEAYLTIPSLTLYLIVEQNAAQVIVHRRGEQGFEAEVYEGLDSVIPLPELETELPLAEIYEGVEFVPEPTDEMDVR